ncbi:hypothetical protein [uncultured Flavobacterium sp.]|uniref:hypothetical protein n=1 Tax=uncultured Flavobacterium sp. TaxID=165435 RepID=UPI003081CA16
MEYKEIKTAIILTLVITMLFAGFELNITKKYYSNKKCKITLTEVTTYTFKIQNSN